VSDDSIDITVPEPAPRRKTTTTTTEREMVVAFTPSAVDGELAQRAMRISKLALEHLEKRLQDTVTAETETTLTIKDRIALAMAPRILTEMRAKLSESADLRRGERPKTVDELFEVSRGLIGVRTPPEDDEDGEGDPS